MKEQVTKIVPYHKPSLPRRANQYPANTHTPTKPTYNLVYNTQLHYNHPDPIHIQTYNNYMPVLKPKLIKADLLMIQNHALTSKHRTPKILPQLQSLWTNYLKG